MEQSNKSIIIKGTNQQIREWMDKGIEEHLLTGECQFQMVSREPFEYVWLPPTSLTYINFNV